MTCAYAAHIFVKTAQQRYFAERQFAVFVRCGRVIRRYRSVGRKLCGAVLFVGRLRLVYDFVKRAVRHQNILIEQPHRRFSAERRKVEVEGYIFSCPHAAVPVPFRSAFIKIFAGEKHTDFIPEKNKHRRAVIVHLVGFQVFRGVVFQCFSVGRVPIHFVKKRILRLIKRHCRKRHCAYFVTRAVLHIHTAHFTVVGQVPVQYIFSRQSTELLNIFTVRQRRIEIRTVELAVRYNEIVYCRTVSVVEIAVKLGIFVYDIFAADELFVVRPIVRNAALLQQNLFERHGIRLCRRGCRFGLLTVRHGIIHSAQYGVLRTVRLC